MGRACSDGILTHIDENGNRLCSTGCPLALTLEDGEFREAEVYLQHKDGHRAPVTVRIAPIRDQDGKIVAGAEIFADRSPRIALAARLEELEKETLLCPLTGVGNRRFLDMTIGAAFHEYQRYQWPFGIIFLDIDHFKRVNDTYGHATGDAVLCMLAKTVAGCLRSFDFLGRWGGEEFIIVAPNVTPESVKGIAERCRMLTESSVAECDGNSVHVTISLGATVVRAGDSVDSLIARADNLMYESKKHGRNRTTLG